MSAASTSPIVYRRDEPIVVDDDDDVPAIIPSASRGLDASPSASLRDVTPAMSVATTSTTSSNHVNGVHALAFEGENDPRDRYRTGYVYSSDMMLHVNPIDPEHPERPLRIWKIFLKFKQNNLFSRMKRIPIREVTEDEVKLVHDHGIWEGVQSLACKLMWYKERQSCCSSAH